MSKYVPEVTNGGYTGKIVDENGNTVAIVNNYEQAILIASAPELLEALRTMTALCRLKYGNLHPEVYDEIVRSGAIIAKAEGAL